MNKGKKGLIFFLLIPAAGILFLLNVNVTIRQGINGVVKDVRMPLYLKLLDFFDRHYNYLNLARAITHNADSEMDRAFKLFSWTIANIRKVPEGFPVVDDHVWHIIVRGYGASDQSQDVFTTLCNYSGLRSFFGLVYERPGAGKRKAFSFVKIDGDWRVFDAHAGVYFVDSRGKLSSISQISSGDWQVKNTFGNKTRTDYETYMANLEGINDTGFRRANIQSPVKRLLFEIKERLDLH
ncbi:hypothetical protein EPN16_02275 [bacterium]|nr:MAG: hypothetical protein EPN16_02275 [bacterium]